LTTEQERSERVDHQSKKDQLPDEADSYVYKSIPDYTCKSCVNYENGKYRQTLKKKKIYEPVYMTESKTKKSKLAIAFTLLLFFSFYKVSYNCLLLFSLFSLRFCPSVM